MRVIRDRADASWLPSRFRFAIFRLFAYFRLRGMAPREQRGLVLSIDRDQSAIDHFAASALMALLTISYAAAALMLVMPAVVAVPLALLITGFVAQLPMYVLGVSLTVIGRVFGAPGENHLAFQNAMFGTVLVGSACWAAASDSWLRFVAWLFLGCVAINVIASVVSLPLRKRMAELENRFGVET